MKINQPRRIRRLVRTGATTVALGAIVLAGTLGAQSNGHTANGVGLIQLERVAKASCEGQPSPPDLDCPNPTPTPTATPGDH